MKTHTSAARPLLWGILATVWLAGCSKPATPQPSPVPTPEQTPVEIRLNGAVATPSIQTAGTKSEVSLPPLTRAVIDQGYASDLSVSFARIDQNSDGTFPDYTAVSALNATRKGNTGGSTGETAITFERSQYYLSRESNNQTKLVGWYPRGAAAAGVVTLTIDGQNDIMLTGELTGDKSEANQFGATGKIFTFNHRLTQLKLSAYAVDEDAKNVWGTLSADGIQLKDQKPQCKIALPATVTFDGTAAPLKLVPKKAATDAAIAYPLALGVSEANSVECGYAMTEPVAAAGSLILTVATEKGGSREVAVTLPANGFEAGKAYDIVLKFSSTDIAPSAQIGQWESVADKVEVVL